ncbi:hypothetical protein K7432_001373 [Basidiobolus ranarum]|uniref:3'-5' exonuclease n=1 Tax=Basidiobolus ranarum TaxID=34480 RepID=A0ABR2X340_9FUNG
MFQLRPNSRKNIAILTQLNFCQLQKRTLTSNSNSKYSSPFRNVLQRIETKCVEEQKPIEVNRLRKYTQQLRTAPTTNGKAEPLDTISAVNTELRTKSEKTSSRFGNLNNREFLNQSRLPTEVSNTPSKVRSKNTIITENPISLSRNNVSSEKRVRTRNQVLVVCSQDLISTGRFKVKVQADPTKRTQSRFVPISQSTPQSERKVRNNVMLHMPILPDRAPSQPVEVKVLGGYRIYLCQSKRQCDEAVTMLRNSVQNRATPFLGFDTESTRYRLGSQVSVIQLASSNMCFIFQVGQIYQSTGKIPESLCKLLADPTILKAGVNATGDAAFLRKAHKLICDRIVNIDSIAQKLGHKHLSMIELVQKFGVDMNLDKTWRKKKWSQTHLTTKEVDYAANDAIASYRLFDALIKRSLIANVKC